MLGPKDVRLQEVPLYITIMFLLYGVLNWFSDISLAFNAGNPDSIASGDKIFSVFLPLWTNFVPIR